MTDQLRSPRRRGTHRTTSAATGALPGPRRDLAAIAPRLHGLSVTGIAVNRAFTWSATDDGLAALDACQYLAGGPCVHAAAVGQPVEAASQALIQEGRWELFASAAEAAGVGATLSLPVMKKTSCGDGRVVGTVNLYGGPVDAFEGRRDELVEWCSGWRPAAALGSVSAGLALRQDRSGACEPHRDQNGVEWALSMLAARLDLDVAVAGEQFRSATHRAGLSESRAAQVLTDLLDPCMVVRAAR